MFKMEEVTLAWMQEEGACFSSQELFQQQLNGRDSIPAGECLSYMMDNGYEAWAGWLFRKVFNDEKLKELTAVLDGYDDYHPGCNCGRCEPCHEKFREWLKETLS